MLVYINDMLSTGYIEGLFTKEDAQALAGGLRNEAKSNGIVDTPENIFQYFKDVLKGNMHTILCFSPVGEDFRIRARKFPGLINCSMIDWFRSWPKDALVDVAYRYLVDVEMESDELRNAIAQDMAEIHCSIDVENIAFLKAEKRHNYTTPKSFLEFKDYYNSLLEDKRKEIQARIDTLESGLDTLA